MWNIAGLKANAKENIRRFYWPALLVCIISGLFNGAINREANRLKNWNHSFNNSYGSATHSFDGIITNLNPMVWLVTGVVASVIMTALIIGIAVRLLVGNPLQVGKKRYFMCNRDGDTGIGEIGYVFNSRRYSNVVKIMLLRSLYTSLWYLLFIIPGIIKTYEYAMVPYILAENPEIESRRAFELSKEMMMGEKWNYFFLQLSFIGWFLLGAVLCGVGQIFVLPYYEATLSEFYGWAREKLFAIGFSNSYELRGFGEEV